ncbi:MAG: M23 family metallopeptidase [Hyphomicrobiales bacterium]|nr:M23 family metallopeptidase [Hyphomicrobiales bacterium]
MRRSTIVVSLFAATMLTGWSAGATWLLLSKDSFGAHMIRRETARQYAYEDRIASLKTEVDKLSSRQLVDQDGVEARVAELVTRQTQLETRQAIVAALTDSVSANQIAAGRAARTPPLQQPSAAVDTTSSVNSFAPTPRPMPVPDMPGLRRESGRRNLTPAGWEQSAVETSPNVDETLALLSHRLAAVQAEQIRALNRLEASVLGAHSSLRTVVAEVGLDPDQIAGMPPRPGQGGPFIPAIVDPKAGAFEASVVRLQPRLAAIERLRSTVNGLPLRRPVAHDVEQSSSFGHRVDPFTRSLAMHSGLDFRAEHGTLVRAAAPGRVVAAEYSGGYGNMVEIEHANGISTRYAHLSHIAVSEGQQLAVGSPLGRVGSTGRSTGPHLHYETRIGGEAVDPQRFLRAGQRFLGNN